MYPKWRVNSSCASTHIKQTTSHIRSQSVKGPSRGIHPPLRPWCISPLFQISPYFQNFFRLSGNFQKISHFHPPKFLTTFFFSHPPQISDSPLFCLFYNIFPPDSRKFLFSLCFSKFSHALRVFFLPPTLTMMHLCITQCTYWTPLDPSTTKFYWFHFGYSYSINSQC